MYLKRYTDIMIVELKKKGNQEKEGLR